MLEVIVLKTFYEFPIVLRWKKIKAVGIVRETFVIGSQNIQPAGRLIPFASSTLLPLTVQCDLSVQDNRTEFKNVVATFAFDCGCCIGFVLLGGGSEISGSTLLFPQLAIRIIDRMNERRMNVSV